MTITNTRSRCLIIEGIVADKERRQRGQLRNAKCVETLQTLLANLDLLQFGTIYDGPVNTTLPIT